LIAPILFTASNLDDPAARARASHSRALAEQRRTRAVQAALGSDEIRRMLIGAAEG
jgi:hypothetical protein